MSDGLMVEMHTMVMAHMRGVSFVDVVAKGQGTRGPGREALKAVRSEILRGLLERGYSFRELSPVWGRSPSSLHQLANRG